MIINAKDIPLASQMGTLPNMSEGLLDWFQPITFTQITKTIVEFNLVETSVQINTMGVRQPFSPQQLSLKPEGQRQWKWQTIHYLPGVLLNIDDILMFNGVNYRVKDKLDWTEYGYLEVHVVEDFKP